MRISTESRTEVAQKSAVKNSRAQPLLTEHCKETTTNCVPSIKNRKEKCSTKTLHPFHVIKMLYRWAVISYTHTLQRNKTFTAWAFYRKKWKYGKDCFVYQEQNRLVDRAKMALAWGTQSWSCCLSHTSKQDKLWTNYKTKLTNKTPTPSAHLALYEIYVVVWMPCHIKIFRNKYIFTWKN